MSTVTAYIEWDEESKMFVGIIPGIPGAHTQGESLDELNRNLQEVLALCLEESGHEYPLPNFVGIQQIEVPV
ncbi:MAG: type II toxin-antitoxin system HicB family antitoxin [bacterium]|nr:type II toxin-antitoxin system HicB family antitoxin [bacterium]